MKDIKVIFMGTPEFAVPILEYLIENTSVVLVVTQPDKETGRGRQLTYSPVKKCALEHNIDVFQPAKIRKEYEIISEINPDIIITCAYGQIVPQGLLDIPKCGCINIHGSLLPKYRGATPMQECLLNGDETTGITLMYMDAGMDTGDMIAKAKIKIEEDETIGTLHDKLSLLGRDLLKDNLESIINGTCSREKQNDEEATYTKMIKREDEALDFSLDGKTIINKIRAFSPWPLTNFKINGMEYKVISAKFEKQNVQETHKIIFGKKEMNITCSDGIIKLIKVKPFGKKEMDVSAYVNGVKKEDNLYAERIS